MRHSFTFQSICMYVLTSKPGQHSHWMSGHIANCLLHFLRHFLRRYQLPAGTMSIQRSPVISSRQNEHAHAVFSENSSRTSDFLYCVCSSKTPLCIHASVYSTKQMSFAWARGGWYFPASLISMATKKWENRIGGNCLWAKEVGVPNKSVCLEFPKMEY